VSDLFMVFVLKKKITLVVLWFILSPGFTGRLLLELVSWIPL